jgi:cytoskeletal protein RodZ
MYSWIWQKLPFGFWGKLTGSLGLAAATGALLWYVIFPWATPLLPFDDVQVGANNPQGPAQEDPNAVSSSSDDGPDAVPYSTKSNAADPTSTAVPKTSKTPKGTTSSTAVVLPGD